MSPQLKTLIHRTSSPCPENRHRKLIQIKQSAITLLQKELDSNIRNAITDANTEKLSEKQHNNDQHYRNKLPREENTEIQPDTNPSARLTHNIQDKVDDEVILTLIFYFFQQNTTNSNIFVVLNSSAKISNIAINNEVIGVENRDKPSFESKEQSKEKAPIKQSTFVARLTGLEQYKDPKKQKTLTMIHSQQKSTK